MIKTLFPMFCTLLFFTFATNAEELLIAGDDNAKPKNWLDLRGEPKGIHIELLDEISRKTGIEFTYSMAPWARVFALSKNGNAAIMGFSKTTEREKLWHYSDPLYFDELVFVSRKDDMFEFSGLGSIRGLTIGIKRGASYGDDFEQAVRTGLIKVVETTDRANQLRMLDAGRVDLVLLSPGRIALETIIKENSWLQAHRDDFAIISPPYKLDPNYIGIPKSMGKEHLLEPINEAIRQIKANGTYERIVQKVTDNIIEELRGARP
ncbi:substrate-binding periplasmic protein [Roseibium sp.]|uniref:substrate-binding periplasmic protein n=1 Tax=Roseibium sp. TaxID=1936156 RepID=UPI003D10875C